MPSASNFLKFYFPRQLWLHFFWCQAVVIICISMFGIKSCSICCILLYLPSIFLSFLLFCTSYLLVFYQSIKQCPWSYLCWDFLSLFDTMLHSKFCLSSLFWSWLTIYTILCVLSTFLEYLGVFFDSLRNIGWFFKCFIFSSSNICLVPFEYHFI